MPSVKENACLYCINCTKFGQLILRKIIKGWRREGERGNGRDRSGHGVGKGGEGYSPKTSIPGAATGWFVGELSSYPWLQCRLPVHDTLCINLLLIRAAKVIDCCIVAL